MPSRYMTREDFENRIASLGASVIAEYDIQKMKRILKPLIGVQFSDMLSIPKDILKAFEPSQIGTIIGTLMDACIPYLSIIMDSDVFSNLGLSKNPGVIGEREGYPDYIHTSGKRLELKLLFVDNPNIELKKPPTPREPSARLTQKVTIKNVDPENDMLLIIAYRLEENRQRLGFYSPTIIGYDIFPVYECILARDRRMYEDNGGWFGEFETPTILSQKARNKLKSGGSIDSSSYGRKADEEKDFNEDTNFGKLKRIPYPPLQNFIKHYLNVW